MAIEIVDLPIKNGGLPEGNVDQVFTRISQLRYDQINRDCITFFVGFSRVPKERDVVKETHNILLLIQV
jgi:hypothetical protein